MSNEQCGDAPTCSCNPKPLNGQHWTGCPEGKVGEIARKLHAFLDSPAFKDSGKHPEDCLADFLGPYFPPASQTNTLFQKVITFLESCRDKAKAECGIYLTANHFETILESLKLATPASTAREPKRIKMITRMPPYNIFEELPKIANQVREISEDLGAELDFAVEAMRTTFEASTARTDGFEIYPQEIWAVAQSGFIQTWGVSKSVAEAQVRHSSTADSQEWEAVGPYRLAAPGSVPQAPDQSAALRTALEALAQDYKEEVRNAETSFAYMNAMEVLGVPQAEPPKEEKP